MSIGKHYIEMAIGGLCIGGLCSLLWSQTQWDWWVAFILMAVLFGFTKNQLE